MYTSSYKLYALQLCVLSMDKTGFLQWEIAA